jgi:acyl-CoA thioester hydrolase
LKGDAPYVRDNTSGLVWHCCRLRAPYADVDRLQVVYHANYLRYFEFGRASLMRDTAYSYRDIEASGYNYPIIAAGVDYFHPLQYDDVMCIHTRPAEMERVKLRFDYIITHEQSGDIACIGYTRHCAVNASGIPVGIDAKTVHLWEIFPK